jgi:hypothetical protein
VIRGLLKWLGLTGLASTGSVIIAQLGSNKVVACKLVFSAGVGVSTLTGEVRKILALVMEIDQVLHGCTAVDVHGSAWMVLHSSTLPIRGMADTGCLIGVEP